MQFRTAFKMPWRLSWKPIEFSVWLLIGLVGMTWIGCGTADFFRGLVKDSRPYEWKKVQELAGQPRIFFDLNHNGHEESVEILDTPHQGNIYRVRFYSDDLELVDQINFNGPIQKLVTFDWNHDGRDEMAFFYTYRDTAFVRILDQRLRTLREAPLFSGRPRVENNVSYPWMGQIMAAFLTDLENDGRDELVVIPSEGYAQSPRGVYVYSVPSLKLKWNYEIGPAIQREPVVADFDGDGLKEIMVPTISTCNRNRANGTDDYHSYIFVFSHDGRLKWRRKFGDKYSKVSAYYRDIDGNHRMEIVAFVQHALASQIRPGIEILDPATGKSLIPERKFPHPFKAHYIGQLNSDLPMEILLADSRGDLMLLNEKLNIVRKVTYHDVIRGIQAVPDITGNGLKEIFCLTSSQFLWINPQNLATLATLPLSGFRFRESQNRLYVYHPLNAGVTLVACDNNGRPVLYVPHKLIAYAVRKWAIPVAAMILLMLALYSTRLLASTQWEKTFFRRTLEKSLAAINQPAFVLDTSDRILMANPLGKMMLHLPDGRFPVSLREVERKNPELAAELRRLRFSDVVRQRFSFVDRKNAGVVEEVIAEPLEHPGHIRPFWFVHVQEKAPHPEFTAAADWAALASRVAHEVKTPLTSIQLALQRLQKEWQRGDNRNGTADSLFQRIFERIEHLRKVTRNFVKLMNLEELSLVPTDLNRFLEQFFNSQAFELPADIRLELQLQPGLPPIRTDREQLQTVVENLISNAVNAMPRGGILTVRTELSRNLRFDDDGGPTTYVTLEILDTGEGISEEMQQFLFKPYLKGGREKVGLGLTIVNKIVRDHGGHVEIHSMVNTGTAVTVYFPVENAVGSSGQSFLRKEDGGQ